MIKFSRTREHTWMCLEDSEGFIIYLLLSREEVGRVSLYGRKRKVESKLTPF